MRRSENCIAKKRDAKKFWLHTHPCVIFHYFFRELSTLLLNEVLLNGPLEGYLEPCQTSAKRGYQAR